MLLRPLLFRPTTHSTSFLHRARPLIIAFGFSIPFFAHSRPVTRYDTSPYSTSPSSSYTHSRDAKTPLTKDGRTLNPAAVKQISLGSILGLGTGFLLSAFSRSLTLLLGLGIVAWQVRTRSLRRDVAWGDFRADTLNSTLHGKATTLCRWIACRDMSRGLI
jgi:hypothetical protein